MLAKGQGAPLGPQGCFISATIFLVWAVAFSVWLLRTRRTGHGRWNKGKGPEMSTISGLVWVLNALIWGALFLAQGLQHTQTTRRISPYLVFGGFALLILAVSRDAIREKRNEQTENRNGSS